MEIPTTSNLEALKDFQDTFYKSIRPVAEDEMEKMPRMYAKSFKDSRGKLLPSSIVMDVMLYLTHYLSLDAADHVQDAKDTGDLERLMSQCNELDPYWQATRSLALALKVFGQDPTNVMEYLGDESDECICYVCGAESPQPLTLRDRKACNGGCPECEETLEAVFPK